MSKKYENLPLKAALALIDYERIRAPKSEEDKKACQEEIKCAYNKHVPNQQWSSNAGLPRDVQHDLWVAKHGQKRSASDQLRDDRMALGTKDPVKIRAIMNSRNLSREKKEEKSWTSKCSSELAKKDDASVKAAQKKSKVREKKESAEREFKMNGSSGIRDFFVPEPVDDLDTVEDIKTDKWFREQALQAFADPSTPQNRYEEYDPMVSGNSGY